MVNPGASFGSIKRFVDMNTSTLAYHLRFLERNGLLRSEKKGRKRCYFYQEKIDAKLLLDLDPVLNNISVKQKKIFDLINRYPGITLTDIRERTGMKKANIQYNIDKLIEFGLVIKVKVDGRYG
jgi:predicted transcriptional regulator